MVATEADGGRPEPADPDATTAGVALQSPVGTGSDEPPVSLSNEGVTSFIEAWESAWESRDAEAVTVLYSDNFPAQAYGGRSAWLAQVKRELATAEYVRVAVSALEIDFPRADTARASFFRNFRSDTRDETRRMVLELEPVEGSWRIRSERFVD